MLKILVYTIVLIAFPILSFAGSYQITYQVQIPAIDQANHIEPLVSNSGDLHGFIIWDSVDNQIVIDDWNADSSVVVQMSYPAIDGLSRTSPDGDSLFIYTAMWREHAHPPLHSIILANGELDSSSVQPFSRYLAMTQDIEALELSFIEIASQSAPAISMQSTLSYLDHQIMIGITEKEASQSLVYTPNLSERLHRDTVSALRFGYLTQNDLQETCSFDNYFSYWNSSTQWETRISQHRKTTVTVKTSEGNVNVQKISEWGTSRAIFVDDFAKSTPTDELIYFGYAADLLSDDTTKHNYVACYDFADGTNERLWYTVVPTLTLEFVHHPYQLIAGRSSNDKVAFLDYRTGQLFDPVSLDRTLTATTFFATGSTGETLNLLGRNHDTLFIYQFDTPTAIETENNISILPNKFVLHPNHPNPFNGETTISFDLIRKQQIKLTIFNIIGQEITTLIDRAMSAGTHRIVWNGLDRNGHELPSGVYLTRLTSGEQSSTTKMLYLK